jgi:hypothetical protein
MRTWRFFGLMCAVTLAIGCGKKDLSVDEAIKQYGAKVESKLATAEAIGKALPSLKEEGVKIDGPAPTLTKVIGVPDHSRRQMGNATMVYSADLADVTTLGKVPFRVDDSAFQNVLNHCGAILRKGTRTSTKRTDKPMDALHIQVCAEIKYLIVINPTVDEPSTNVKAKTYMPGIFRAEVLFFDLDTRDFLGGFWIFNTQKGDDAAGTIKTRSSNLAGEVDGRFQSQIRFALDRDLKKYAGVREVYY